MHRSSLGEGHDGGAFGIIGRGSEKGCHGQPFINGAVRAPSAEPGQRVPNTTMVLPWAEMSSCSSSILRMRPTVPWGATDDLADLLAGDLDLHAIRVGHGIRLFGQVEQGLGNAAGHVQEGGLPTFWLVCCRRLAIWDRRIRMSGLTWIS